MYICMYLGSILGRGREEAFPSSPHRADRLEGPPSLQWVPMALSLGIKRPKLEADHSSPASAVVKNTS
jgi:hypothetical protein